MTVRRTSVESAAAFIESQQRRRSRRKRARQERLAPRPAPGPYAMLRIPASTHHRLVEHCRQFGIRPQTFIERMLDQAALSRGGV